MNEALPDGFQMTELGPLPKEWRVVRLGEAVKLTKGRKPDELIPKYQFGALPYLTADYFRNGLPVRWVPAQYLSKLPFCSKEDVVLIWDGSKAGQVFIGLEGVLASTMVRIDPEKQIERHYLYYFLLTQFDLLNSKTTGTTIPHVNKEVFRNLPIPFPPLDEQRAIAHVLRTVQRAKEATEGVIAALRELKKSLMQHLFTYGPVPVGAKNFSPQRESEIGPLPAHWRVVRLGEVFDILQGKSLSAKQNKGVRPRPFLRTSNVYWGYLDLSKLDVMDFTEEEEQKFALQRGDLLVCEGGNVGRTAMWEGQMQGVYYQNHLHRLRARDNNVNPAFVMYWLQTAFTLLNLYSGSSNKTTIPNLSQGRLAVFPIPLPPLDEQREIARILQAVDAKIVAEQARRTALEELFKTLLHQLMSGQIRLPNIVGG
jgi:type I restriction enzyme S subunit